MRERLKENLWEKILKRTYERKVEGELMRENINGNLREKILMRT